MRSQIIFGLCIVLSIFFLSCAHREKGRHSDLFSGSNTPQTLGLPPPFVSANELKTQSNLSDWDHLKAYEKVSIDIPFADVVVTQDLGHRQGSLHVSPIEGKPDCKLVMFERLGSQLIIQQASSDSVKDKNEMAVMKGVDLFHPKYHSSVSSDLGCHYNIILSLHQSTQLNIALKRGSVRIENWASPSDVKMEWGDIDVSSVGPLTVSCSNCNLMGSGINGPLQYQMTTGNVGVDNLTDSVEGKTFGDTVLKWNHVKPQAKIHLVSDAGDIILSFPGKLPLAMNLQVPHGEIYSIFTPSEQGIPLSVIAKRGNIKLLRSDGGSFKRASRMSQSSSQLH